MCWGKQWAAAWNPGSELLSRSSRGIWGTQSCSPGAPGASGAGMVFHWSCCPRPARKPVVKARCLSAYLLVCSLLLTLCPVGKVTNKGVESWLWSYSCAVCAGVTWGHSSMDCPAGPARGSQQRLPRARREAGSGVWTQITAQTPAAALDAADGALRNDIKGVFVS